MNKRNLRSLIISPTFLLLWDLCVFFRLLPSTSVRFWKSICNISVEKSSSFDMSLFLVVRVRKHAHTNVLNTHAINVLSTSSIELFPLFQIWLSEAKQPCAVAVLICVYREQGRPSTLTGLFTFRVLCVELTYAFLSHIGIGFVLYLLS